MRDRTLVRGRESRGKGRRSEAYLVSARTGFEVFVGQIEFLDAQGAVGRNKLAWERKKRSSTKTYQNSSSSSMTESICCRLDIITRQESNRYKRRKKRTGVGVTESQQRIAGG